MDDDGPSCAACAWAHFEIDGDEPFMECRRFPPLLEDDGVVFPGVDAELWCGEFRPTQLAPETRGLV